MLAALAFTGITSVRLYDAVLAAQRDAGDDDDVVTTCGDRPRDYGDELVVLSDDGRQVERILTDRVRDRSRCEASRDWTSWRITDLFRDPVYPIC